MDFEILLMLILIKKSFSTCGTEPYSVYQAELTTACYNTNKLDGLPLLDEKNMPDGSIYFVDASCKGGLNLREACSVEAAARVNPLRQVNVLFTGPVTKQCVQSEPLSSLNKYTNVRLYRIYFEEFASAPDFAHLLKNIGTNWSYPVLTSLNILKYITLYKFNGIYMDLDMLATRPFDDLPHKKNWLGIYNYTLGTLSDAVLAASSDVIGRKLIRNIVKTLKTEPSPEVGSFHSISKAAEMICGVIPFNSTGKSFSYTCHGLVLYARKFFFPVPCEMSREYFDSFLDLRKLTRSFTQQLCNSMTFKEIITSQSVYAQLMSKYCPSVHEILRRNEFREDIHQSYQGYSGSNEVVDEERRPTKKPEDEKKNNNGKWYYEIGVKL